MGAKHRFTIKSVGADLQTVRNEWGPYWELLVYCEDAGLYQQEARAVLLWARGFRRTQIATLTGIHPTDVSHTIARGVRRIANKYRPRYRGGIGWAWAVLKTFRNTKNPSDHGPQLSGTRNRGYREMTAPMLVSADDLQREDDSEPLAQGLLELIS